MADRLHEMQVFVAVAEEGSFTRAAARLRASPPAVTRAISSLEDRLGVRLLNRSTRSLNLTEPGERFLRRAAQLVIEVEQAEHEAAGEMVAARGHLAITAPSSFGRMALPSVLSGFLTSYPEVTTSVLLLDRVVNLIEEGIDVGIRMGTLADSSLIARRIGEVRRVLVASPDYLARRGEPRHPIDLKAHDIIGFTGLMANREWRYADSERRGLIALTPRLEVNEAVIAIAAAEAGDGITLTLCYMIGENVASGRLRPVLTDFWSAPVPSHLIYPQSRLVAPKVRAFMDYAAPALSRTLKRLSAPVVESYPPAESVPR